MQFNKTNGNSVVCEVSICSLTTVNVLLISGGCIMRQFKPTPSGHNNKNVLIIVNGLDPM